MAAALNGNGGSASGLSSERTKVSVLGGGAWGSALALHAARMGHDVLLWALEKEVAQQINEQHENTTFLPVGGNGWLGRLATLPMPTPVLPPACAHPDCHACASMLKLRLMLSKKYNTLLAAPAGLSAARLAARLQRHQGGGGAWRDPAPGHPHSLCGAHGEQAGRQVTSGHTYFQAPAYALPPVPYRATCL